MLPRQTLREFRLCSWRRVVWWGQWDVRFTPAPGIDHIDGWAEGTEWMNERCHFQLPDVSMHRGFVILSTPLRNQWGPICSQSHFRNTEGLPWPPHCYTCSGDSRPLSGSWLTFSCVSRALAALQESQELREIWDPQEFQGFTVRQGDTAWRRVSLPLGPQPWRFLLVDCHGQCELLSSSLLNALSGWQPRSRALMLGCIKTFWFPSQEPVDHWHLDEKPWGIWAIHWFFSVLSKYLLGAYQLPGNVILTEKSGTCEWKGE